MRIKLSFSYVVVIHKTTGGTDKDEGAAERRGGGGTKGAQGNENLCKTKKSLPIMFVSVRQQC